MDLEEAFDRHAASMYRHALALTCHRADAEDAVQNVFAKLAALSGAANGGSRPAIEDLEAYLHVAVRREALRTVERRKRTAPEGACDFLAARNGVSSQETLRVNLALGELPPEQREVVLLHVWQGMTFQRIGEVLGIPADTAASRYRYARGKLKEALSGD